MKTRAGFCPHCTHSQKRTWVGIFLVNLSCFRITVCLCGWHSGEHLSCITMMEAKTTGFHPAQLSINTAANQIQIRNQLSLRIAKVKGLAELNEAGEQSVLKKVKKKKKKKKKKESYFKLYWLHVEIRKKNTAKSTVSSVTLIILSTFTRPDKSKRHLLDCHFVPGITANQACKLSM